MFISLSHFVRKSVRLDPGEAGRGGAVAVTNRANLVPGPPEVLVPYVAYPRVFDPRFRQIATNLNLFSTG